MRFTIDLAACEDHGQCVYTAPDLFSLDDDGEQALRRDGGSAYTSPELGEAEAAQARQAAAVCPMGAITVTG